MEGFIDTMKYDRMNVAKKFFIMINGYLQIH